MVVEKGVATFDQIIFIGKPSSSNNKFLIVANSFKKSKLIDIFGKDYYEANLQGDLTVSFRECLDGEEEQSSEC